MKQLLTTGIILSRTDFGEADRIITLLTPNYGKLRLVAKGVRRIKSKMAGGIELFSVSQITFIQGRGDLGTLVSTRLEKHYRHIIEDIERTMLGYDLIKQLNKITEDEPEAEYFDLLEQSFSALDDPTIDKDLVKLWFSAQLLRLGGHTPNLQQDTAGNKLSAEASYDFGYDETSFTPNPDGLFKAHDIKFLRLVFNGNSPAVLSKVSGAERIVGNIKRLIESLTQQHG